MREFFGLFLLLSIVACNDRAQTANASTVDTISKETNTIKREPSHVFSNSYGFDTAYETSKEHAPFVLTGYFNPDNVLDTAVLIRYKLSGKDALFIKHGGIDKTFLLKTGNDVGTDFNDFSWVGQFKVIKKGTTIFNNVIDGEIVGSDQVPDSNKITLQTDAILVHEDEGGGGGIIYFNNGHYTWVQQD